MGFLCFYVMNSPNFQKRGDMGKENMLKFGREFVKIEGLCLDFDTNITYQEISIAKNDMRISNSRMRVLIGETFIAIGE
jgi:hypothetical protein